MKIIPLPKRILKQDGVFVFDSSCGISTEFSNIADNFRSFVSALCRFDVGVGCKIALLLSSQVAEKEGYELDISDNIEITASTENGLFYGVQTLKLLIAEYFADGKAEIPRMRIVDAPRFAYRGFMFDCCRHFFGVDVIKKMIDACALLKLNVFHWHLTEDQGWRMQIDKYPKLVDVGSKRAETRGDGKPVEGYFSKEQIREIVDYAKARYIDVLPEFDLPGHTRAALAAYPELSCAGKATSVATHFGIHSEILCAGNPETYEFIYGVLDEMAELFPFPYVHIGGDEAVKIEWAKCEKCLKTVKDEGLKNVEQLQGFMTKKVIDHLKTLGKTAICWNESVNSGILDESAVMQYWQDGKNPVRVLDAIEKGRRTIVSKFENYYLDYPYGMTPLKKTYEYEPIFFEGDAACEANVWGVEAPLWTEFVSDYETVEKRVFPRLIAVAESGWTRKDGKSYESFVSRLPAAETALLQYGIHSVSAHDANPGFFRGAAQLIKFGLNMIDCDTIKRGRAVVKEIKKTRRDAAEEINKQ